MSHRVFVSRLIPEAGLEILRARTDLDVWSGEMPPSPTELRDRVKGCDGAICLLSDTIDAAFFKAAGPALKVVSLFAAGYNNVDMNAAREARVIITNTPDQLTEATAELAFTLMAAAARRVKEGIDNVRDGQWRTWGPLILRGRDLRGSTLGIIGMGRIGAALARRAVAFGMQVVFFDPSPFMIPPGDAPVARVATLDELLGRSDFVSLHCPLTPQTRHIIRKETIALMKPGCVLVNTARGPCIDTDALVDALKENRIFAAGLDVTDPEPLPADHPLVSLPNCLILPHVGSATFSTRDAMAVGAARNLLDVLDNRLPADTLNPDVFSLPH